MNTPANFQHESASKQARLIRAYLAYCSLCDLASHHPGLSAERNAAEQVIVAMLRDSWHGHARLSDGAHALMLRYEKVMIGGDNPPLVFEYFVTVGDLPRLRSHNTDTVHAHHVKRLGLAIGVMIHAPSLATGGNAP